MVNFKDKYGFVWQVSQINRETGNLVTKGCFIDSEAMESYVNGEICCSYENYSALDNCKAEPLNYSDFKLSWLLFD